MYATCITQAPSTSPIFWNSILTSLLSSFKSIFSQPCANYCFQDEGQSCLEIQSCEKHSARAFRLGWMENISLCHTCEFWNEKFIRIMQLVLPGNAPSMECLLLANVYILLKFMTRTNFSNTKSARAQVRTCENYSRSRMRFTGRLHQTDSAPVCVVLSDNKILTRLLLRSKSAMHASCNRQGNFLENARNSRYPQGSSREV
jgi:hypothetical protein